MSAIGVEVELVACSDALPLRQSSLMLASEFIKLAVTIPSVELDRDLVSSEGRLVLRAVAQRETASVLTVVGVLAASSPMIGKIAERAESTEGDRPEVCELPRFVVQEPLLAGGSVDLQFGTSEGELTGGGGAIVALHDRESEGRAEEELLQASEGPEVLDASRDVLRGPLSPWMPVEKSASEDISDIRSGEELNRLKGRILDATDANVAKLDFVAEMTGGIGAGVVDELLVKSGPDVGIVRFSLLFV